MSIPLEYSGIAAVNTYNLGDYTVVVRLNSKLARGEVRCIIDDRLQAITIDTRGTTLRIIGESSRSLYNSSEDPTSQKEGILEYPNGLRVTSTDRNEVTYQLSTSPKGVIVIEGPSTLLVSVDGDIVSIWLA